MNALTPTETVLAVLRDATDPATIAALVEPDATYVSLNYDNPDLRRIMPWWLRVKMKWVCGSRCHVRRHRSGDDGC